MSYPFGRANAQETAIAHEVAESEAFEEDPVHCYQRLLDQHGVEATGRIWSLACTLYDKAKEVS